MNTIIIIQARMGSSRLPGKVLMPLGETVVLDYVVSRCKLVGANEVIVATSTLSQDDVIEEWCKANQVICFRGSEDDVLSRYYECAKQYQPDAVMRVTADCPFVCYELAQGLIAKLSGQPADYVRIQGKLPRGLASELFTWSALQYIYAHGQEPRHREHVTYYGYEFAEEFNVTVWEAPRELCHPELRITLDTPEDYALCQRVAEYFQGDKLVSAKQVVQYLLDHPEVARLNAHIKQKPVI